MTDLEAKAKEIYLRMNSYSNCSKMNGIDREWILKKIKEGLREYAEEYHQSELLKLNKSDVVGSAI